MSTCNRFRCFNPAERHVEITFLRSRTSGIQHLCQSHADEAEERSAQLGLTKVVSRPLIRR